MNHIFPKNIKYLIGVDEVGRGPVAGPVAVGVVAIKFGDKILNRKFKYIKDSKQISFQKREYWVGIAKEEVKKGNIKYKIAFVSHTIIDTKGISFAIRKAIKSSIKNLSLHPRECFVLLDGGLKAPKEFLYQKTIIRGDVKEKIIALASVVAKVARDKKMICLAKKYPQYGFKEHKGYLTKFHLDVIKQIGICPIHRASFLKKILSI